MQQLTSAQNALLGIGSAPSAAAGGLVVASSTNTFTSVLPGVSLQIDRATGQPVTVSVASDDSQLATTLQSFVNDYNSFITPTQYRHGLRRDHEHRRVLSGRSGRAGSRRPASPLVAGTFGGGGTLQSLAQVGVTVQGDGTLAFDQ